MKKLISWIFGMMLFLFPIMATAQTEMGPQLEVVKISGQIKLPSSIQVSKENLDVVLLKFVLSEAGDVQPVGPQGRVKTNSEGGFEFTDVVPDFRAAYQLGTRIQGELQSSKVFFIRAGQSSVVNNIIIPGISTDVTKLETAQVSLVIESGMGEVLVTEVVSLSNQTEDNLDSNSNPLVMNLPEGWSEFRMIEGKSRGSIAHELEGNQLKIQHMFPKGNTQVIFQYLLPAWFGSLEFNKKFNHPLEQVGVFTPVGRLEISSNKLSFVGEQNLNTTKFLTWHALSSSDQQLSFKISNVPVNSLQFIGVATSLLVLLFLAVLIFYRMRLPRSEPLPSK